MATYTELVAKVKDWSNRGDISSDTVGDFLDIAMKKINNVMRIPPMEQITTITTTDATTSISVPADMIEVIYIRTIDDNGSTLELYKSKIDARSFVQQNINGFVSSDYEFTRVGGSYKFSPGIGKDTKVEIYYYRVLPDLDATYDVGTCSIATDPVTGPEVNCTGTFTMTGTQETPHWFRDEADEILIYGALAELWSYYGESEEQAKWTEKFKMRIDELMKEQHMRELRGGTTTANIITNGLI